MNLNIAKYTLLAATVSLAACQRDDDGYSEQIPAEEGNMSFTATFENSLSKAQLHFNGETPASSTKILTYFQANDALSVFDGMANNKFITKDNSTSVTFTGTAKDSEKGYYALFPYNSAATISDDGTIATSIPTKQTERLEGIIGVAHTDAGSGDFVLRNATAIMGLHSKNTIISLKIESTKPIAGDVTIKLNDKGIPVTTGGTSNTIELTDAAKGGYISMMPTSGANMVIEYKLPDGTSRKVYFRNLTLTRSQILDFGNVDELCTISLDVSGIPGASADDFSVKMNSTPSLPNSIGEGISYNGWIGSDGEYYGRGYTLKPVTTDMSFVAVAGNEKILIFKYNGKTMFKQFKAGTEVEMPIITEAPEGKVFKGWVTSPSSVKVEYEAGKSYVVPVTNESRDFYAFYETKDVTITLDANGGKFADNTTTKKVVHKWGESVELSLEPTYASHWFKGWDGAATHDFKSDITFKAAWGAMSKITYKDFNGNTAKTEEYKDGGEVVISNEIQLGAMIKAWNTRQDGNGTEYIPGQTYNNLTGNITLYPIRSEQKPSTLDPWTIEDL